VFPFRSDPEDDILAFDVYFLEDHRRRIIFIARRRDLLSLATSPQGAITSMQPAIKAWEDWGPRTTHWMELDPLNDTISLAGSRCVLVKYSHLRSHFVLDLRDFNPHRVRAWTARNRTASTTVAATTAAAAAAAAAASGRSGVAAHAHQAILSAEACFEEDVVSELPFVSIKKENVGSRVLLDDEWMAEILVRRPFFCFCLTVCLIPRAYLLTTLCAATRRNSGIRMPKHRSSSSVPFLLCLLWSLSSITMLYDILGPNTLYFL
jgi:hypothetical protein